MGKSEQVNNAQLAHDLGERVKELECLYGIARIEDTPDLSSSQIYQKSLI
ncbi:MAG: hypothetical protein KAX16_06130 [Actinomycetia bacterium]|nr:hypothetical protein [Actinomycetes bacterium]